MGDSINGDGPGMARALWYTAPRVCAIRECALGPLKSDEVLIRSLFSCVSRGTEGLVLRGDVPESEWARMRAPFQEGDFPFPVKYGYANVGEVLDGPSHLIGSRVFSLFPHQTVFSLPLEACVPIPASLPSPRAGLAANMETALNALWDGKPSPGDHICVVGGGVVGLLTAYVCQQLPGSTITLIDTNPRRAALAEAFGVAFAQPEQAPADQDLVFHTSATASGLSTALRSAGDGATVIEMSWYGDKRVEVPLGADFHSRRLKLVSSQVGTIAAERLARWTYRRRLETAMSLLDDPVLDRLISHQVPFEDAPDRLPEVLNTPSDVLAALIVYDQASTPGSADL